MVEGGCSKEYGLVKRLAYGEPGIFARLVDLLVEATGAYQLRQIQAGAEAVQLFDSWAGVLPPAELERWVIAPTRRIVDAVRAAAPKVPVISFPRGAGLLYERAGTRVDAVGLDDSVPPGLGGAGAAAPGGGPFVFNLGHGVQQRTPPEHVGALIRHLRGDRRA